MIILTGGTGFIGSCLLAALNDAGHSDILVVDSLGRGEKWKNLVGTRFTDIISKQEFRERIGVEDFGEVQAVIHLGACSSTTETDADYLLDNNYRYSIDVAEFALECGARFVYASSAATYGNGLQGYADTATDLRPLNMYGYSKHMFDYWVREQGLVDSVVGVKFFNVFGPNEYHKGSMQSMVAKAYQQIVSTGSIRLFESNDTTYANGEQQRDFVYVKDCCAALLSILENDSVHGILNLGSGTPSSWNSLAAAVFSAMNVPVNIEYIPMPDSISAQYQNYTCADMSNTLSKLPNLTFLSLQESVADYVNGHLSKSWPFYRN